MLEREQLRTKYRIKVEVTLIDGSRMCGDLFLGVDQRVLDLFNDHRPFVPFEDADSEVRVLSKTAIMQIRPIQQNLPMAKLYPLKAAVGRN